MEKQLWNGLLYLRKVVASWSDTPGFCCFDVLHKKICLDKLPAFDSSEVLLVIHFTEKKIDLPDATHFSWSDDFQLRLLDAGQLPAEVLSFLQSYLPYCLYTLCATQRKRAVTIAHFAQTLDGKIATGTGRSKWIGNEENQKHAHRMRALCDAILIGRFTLTYDQPKLTVRHVEGENPRRIVLTTRKADLSCLLDACQDPVLVVSNQDFSGNGTVRYLQLPCDNGRLHSHDILKKLYQQGYKTVYIEGGAKTTSNFIKDRAVDILQLHLSPQIFGSGRQAIVLPEIQEVEESIRFSRFHYQTVGDTLMFVGQLNWDN